MIKQTILKLLPKSFKRQLKRLLEGAELSIMRLFAKNPKLSSLYYLIFSREFDREHHAVLNARLAYHRSLTDGSVSSSALLRRNTHRLEKGLIMRPRKPVFALNYIEETVDAFLHVKASRNACSQEISWASDVLSEFFSAVDKSDSTIKTCFDKFSQSQPQEVSGNLPYPRATLATDEVSYEQLLSLCKQRRSVRWYQDEPVDINLLRQAAEIATLAPSACNRQPFRFLTINDSNQATQVANTAMGTVGFADNIPAMIVVIGELSAYPHERDRHVIYIDGSLAAMQMMLALETLGLSSCPINWPDVNPNEKQLSKLLKLEAHERPVMLMAIGKADNSGLIPFSQKKTPQQIVQEVSL